MPTITKSMTDLSIDEKEIFFNRGVGLLKKLRQLYSRMNNYLNWVNVNNLKELIYILESQFNITQKDLTEAQNKLSSIIESNITLESSDSLLSLTKKKVKELNQKLTDEQEKLDRYYFKLNFISDNKNMTPYSHHKENAKLEYDEDHVEFQKLVVSLLNRWMNFPPNLQPNMPIYYLKEKKEKLPFFLQGSILVSQLHHPTNSGSFGIIGHQSEIRTFNNLNLEVESDDNIKNFILLPVGVSVNNNGGFETWTSKHSNDVSVGSIELKDWFGWLNCVVAVT